MRDVTPYVRHRVFFYLKYRVIHQIKQYLMYNALYGRHHSLCETRLPVRIMT